MIDHSRDKRDRSAGQQQLAGILTQIIQGKSVSHQVRSHVQARDLGSTRQALKKRLYGTGRKGTVPITEKQRLACCPFLGADALQVTRGVNSCLAHGPSC